MVVQPSVPYDLFQITAPINRQNRDERSPEPRLVYDPCIIDVVVLGSGEHVVVYDLNKSVGALMLEQGWARDESKEWLLFNAEQVMFDYQLQEKT